MLQTNRNSHSDRCCYHAFSYKTMQDVVASTVKLTPAPFHTTQHFQNACHVVTANKAHDTYVFAYYTTSFRKSGAEAWERQQRNEHPAIAMLTATNDNAKQLHRTPKMGSNVSRESDGKVHETSQHLNGPAKWKFCLQRSFCFSTSASFNSKPSAPTAVHATSIAS